MVLGWTFLYMESISPNGSVPIVLGAGGKFTVTVLTTVPFGHAYHPAFCIKHCNLRRLGEASSTYVVQGGPRPD